MHDKSQSPVQGNWLNFFSDRTHVAPNRPSFWLHPLSNRSKILERATRFELATHGLGMRLYTFSAMLERRRKPYFTEFFYFFVVLDWSLLEIILEVSSPNYPQRTIATNPDFSLDLGSKTDYRSLRLIMPNGILLVN